MGGEPDRVTEFASERLRRFGFQFIDHPAADGHGELLQGVTQNSGTQRRALGHVQEHVSVEVAHLQPWRLVARLCPGHHLRHLHGVIDGEARHRRRQRTEGARHHLADVAAGVDVGGPSHRGVHLVEVPGQRRDRACLQPPQTPGPVDRPFQIQWSAPVLRGPQRSRPDVVDVPGGQDGRPGHFVDGGAAIGVQHDMLGGG